MSSLTPEVVGWAQASQAKWQIPASLILSAAAVESNFGKATPPNTNNWFGIKAAHGVMAPTGEQTPGGVRYTIEAGFMVFKTPADGFMYYGELLGTHAPYRAMVTTLLRSPRKPVDVQILSHALTGVYATALDYGAALIAAQQKYYLYQYDEETPLTDTASLSPSPTAAPLPAGSLTGAAPVSAAPAPAAPAVVAVSAPAAPPTQNTTQLTLAYGAAAQQALVMLDQGIDLVFATIYAKYVPAFVAVFIPSTTVTSVIDAEFAQWEKDLSGKALTFDTQSTLIKNILLALMTAFPALEAALTGLPTALVGELKQLGVLK